MITITTPAKLPDSIIEVQFNFISELVGNASISGATVSIETLVGDDPAPELLLDGAPSISGGSIFQRIIDGIPGVIYQLTVFATLSNGNLPGIQTKLAIIE